MIAYSEPLIQRISNDLLTQAQVTLLVMREDLNHLLVSGNKWWKLKGNLNEANRLGYKKLLTFGGAYSNHIYATAAAAKLEGFESVGIIRGEEQTNRTLSFAQNCGMDLHFVSREMYRRKTEIDFRNDLVFRYGECYIIPEGGSNEWAVRGCIEWAGKINQIDFDYLCLPVGTGGTLAGLIAGLKGRKIIGYSVLKGGSFLKDEVTRMLEGHNARNVAEWRLVTDYHFGGYAKITPELIDFIERIYARHQLLLDPVYTAKMMYGILDEVKNGKFARGSTILAIHTGGLQGLDLKEILKDFR